MPLPRPVASLALALVGALSLGACSSVTTELARLADPVEAAANPVPTTGTPTPAQQVAVSAAGEAEDAVEPESTVIKLRPRPAPGPFKMNLYRKGDFVHQAHKDWCVVGSTLTMMNIMDEGHSQSSAKKQQRIYERGRELSPLKGKLGSIGVDLLGWTALLNNRGYGPYEIAGARTLEGAIQRAAKAIRKTGRPVGLVTWRGAHSWVMSGFTATADPAYDKDFKVKAVNIQDTWYPYVSTIWGASRPPNTLVPVQALHEDYLRYQRPNGKWPRRDGKYMLILPVLPEGTVAR